MPPPPVLELDPNIQAFNIIDERLSNIEENQALFKEALQLEEMRRSGPLNRKLLGFPFNIDRRLRSDESNKDTTPFPDAAIVTVVPQCDYETNPSHYDCCCFSTTAPERKMLSDSEINSLLSQVGTDDCEAGACHQTRNHGVSSVYRYVCEEALERLYAQKLSKNFSRVYGLARSLDEHTIALCADMPSRTTVSDYVAEAVKHFLSAGHELRCVASVYIKDCSFSVVVLHHDLMTLNNMPDGNLRKLTEKNCKVYLSCPTLSDPFRENEYFKSYKDSYPPFAVDILGW
jgi:hypothetical protein